MQPILEIQWHWADETQCVQLAQAWAALPALRDCLLFLQGPLGAGKTSFTRHLLRALGVQGRIKSPSYALIEQYSAGAGCGTTTISHCDFYRFKDPGEWEDAGLRDVFSAPGLKLVEWPEKAASLLPQADLLLGLEAPNTSDFGAEGVRDVRAVAYTSTGATLIQAVAAGLQPAR